VQDWEQLAFYIARNDSSLYQAKDTLRYTTDSISNWIRNEEMHKIVIKNKFPIFIRYFSCAYSENGIRFYDDIYGSDIKLREKYFALK
jgi:murein L,D-transpeptidase YcbB/YkuD